MPSHATLSSFGSSCGSSSESSAYVGRALAAARLLVARRDGGGGGEADVDLARDLAGALALGVALALDRKSVV